MDVGGRSVGVVFVVLAESVGMLFFGAFLLCFYLAGGLLLEVGGDEAVLDGFFDVAFADGTAHTYQLSYLSILYAMM